MDLLSIQSVSSATTNKTASSTATSASEASDAGSSFASLLTQTAFGNAASLSLTPAPAVTQRATSSEPEAREPVRRDAPSAKEKPVRETADARTSSSTTDDVEEDGDEDDGQSSAQAEPPFWMQVGQMPTEQAPVATSVGVTAGTVVDGDSSLTAQGGDDLLQGEAAGDQLLSAQAAAPVKPVGPLGQLAAQAAVQQQENTAPVMPQPQTTTTQSDAPQPVVQAQAVVQDPAAAQQAVQTQANTSAQAQGIAKAMGTQNQGKTVKVEVDVQQAATSSTQNAPATDAAKVAPTTGLTHQQAAVANTATQDADAPFMTSGEVADAAQDAVAPGTPSLGQQVAQNTAQGQGGPGAHAAQTMMQSPQAQQTAAVAAGATAAGAAAAAADASATATAVDTAAATTVAAIDDVAGASSSGSSTSSSMTTPLGTFGQSLSAQQGTSTAGQTQAAANPQSPLQQQAVEQVKVKITQQAAQGLDNIRIQLNPAELGRVDVKLSVRDGRVTAHVTADSQSTLDALKADATGLVKSLGDAGLQADSNSLSFSLRGENAAGQMMSGNEGGNGRGAGNPYGGRGQTLEDGLDLGVPDMETIRSQQAAARGGVDINV
ncbi:flagellar hook-length control protein FliK [Insolitispirillum peregrinum]|uniref:Flagellar hook-length control protein FliK n=1 Tax=Insolitispirillum peregrinum TaxID=80876 RepID=A0A1N7IQY8_9PROT|nr:flagellar hook-length control protein FliK [Insolitispirillum peregrinum]SIS39499.1 Flagellar hook-length control protein FliK [Insolitispirillum peregrinum]